MKRVIRKIRSDRGAALVTVLLLVSVMAAGAAVTFDMLGYSVKRATNDRIYGQARYYALGGEQLALSAAENIYRNNIKSFLQEDVSYPIDGGRIDGVLTDVSNCFNVNSLVQASDGNRLAVRPGAVAEYRRLLASLGLADAVGEQLSDALVDWLDSDSQSRALGAEDYDYSVMKPPYRAANSLVADLSELYRVRGYSRELMASLSPFLCVGSNSEPQTLNVNSMRVEEAPLLQALVGGDFSLASAVKLIATRPPRGYADVGDFWRDPVFGGMQIEQSVRGRTAVKPQRFESRIRVTFHEATSHMASMIEIDNDGAARISARRYGVIQ
ncbi:MAG: general secretion pathway protein GspK [Alphaproteobacteria bacterium]|nr:MAG: general secretion pathway protein GspK [Alphaproteobacteria bacterium]